MQSNEAEKQTNPSLKLMRMVVVMKVMRADADADADDIVSRTSGDVGKL